jgi:GxxExxY protein
MFVIAARDFGDVQKARDPVTEKVLGLAIEVHRALGPGLLESAYCACLAREMELAGLSFQRELAVPLKYKGILIPTVYRLYFLVENELILEIKVVGRLELIHESQLLTYLRLMGKKTGLLLNFNELLLKDGIIRRAL